MAFTVFLLHCNSKSSAHSFVEWIFLLQLIDWNNPILEGFDGGREGYQIIKVFRELLVPREDSHSLLV